MPIPGRQVEFTKTDNFQRIKPCQGCGVLQSVWLLSNMLIVIEKHLRKTVGRKLVLLISDVTNIRVFSWHAIFNPDEVLLVKLPNSIGP